MSGISGSAFVAINAGRLDRQHLIVWSWSNRPDEDHHIERLETSSDRINISNDLNSRGVGPDRFRSLAAVIPRGWTTVVIVLSAVREFKIHDREDGALLAHR